VKVRHRVSSSNASRHLNPYAISRMYIVICSLNRYLNSRLLRLYHPS
jgi:hypothetical protein